MDHGSGDRGPEFVDGMYVRRRRRGSRSIEKLDDGDEQ